MRPALRSVSACRHAAALAVALTAALSTGCERTQAGEAAELLRAQDAVLAASNAEPAEGQTALEARLAKLEEAAGLVEPLANSENPQRRTLALQLLAEIASARSQAVGLEGRAAAAALRSDLTRVLAGVDSAERDAARAEAQQLDPGPAIARLESARVEDAARLEATRSAGRRLDQEAEAAQAEIAAAKEQRTAAAGREASLVDAAFLEGGDDRYRMLGTAAEARSDADAAASKERAAEIRLAQVEREREVAGIRAELAEQGVKRMDDAAAAFTEAGTAAEAAVLEAQRAAEGGARTAAERAAELAGRFRERVLGPMDAAAAAAAEAAGHLEAAGTEPLDLAAARMNEADSRTAAAVAAEGFADGLAAIGSRLQAVDAGTGSELTSLAEALRGEAEERRNAASETLSAARATLEQTSAEEPAAATLREVAGRLESVLAAG